MAIILKIDKPKSCAECILTYAKVCPLTNNSVVKNIINNTLSKDCPLRSADEMKNEMLDYSFSIVNPSNTYEYVNVVNLEDIETIIDKYCDKESKDVRESD